MIDQELLNVIVRPLLTERSTLLTEKENRYAFEVADSANKGQIKRAVEDLFKVEVTAVRTMRLPGKTRRMGRFEGRRSDWKKAIVSLKAGQKIDLTSEAK